MATKTITRMPVKEFRELGILQELNRQFLHPLGLALEVEQPEDGSAERFGGIWDYRGDPEGLMFGTELPLGPALAVDALRRAHAAARIKLMGAIVQPIEGLAKARAEASRAEAGPDGKRPVIMLDDVDSGEASMVIDEGGAQEISVHVDEMMVFSLDPRAELTDDGERTLTFRRRDLSEAEIAAIPEV